MKTIRKNFLLLAFAVGALFLIGNNVFAGEDPNESEDPGYGGGGFICYRTGTFQLYDSYRSCTDCKPV